MIDAIPAARIGIPRLVDPHASDAPALVHQVDGAVDLGERHDWVIIGSI
jgi:hypothetical protein